MKYKNIISELLKQTSVESAEKSLLFTFLKQNNVNYTKSIILNRYFNNFCIEDNVIKLLNTIRLNTISELNNCLELLIPDEDKKLNGAFFTPDYIVNYIINEITPSIDAKNLDPSCGCGAFLVGLTNFYKNNYNKPIKDIIKENIYGSDILEYNIIRTKIILTIYALLHSEYLEDNDFNLFHQDSLRSSWDIEFDNIVGNPPYVKFQDLSEDNRIYLLNNWSTVNNGTYNLYFVFFELGYSLLKPNGKLGYITPNNYFTSLAGEPLRQFFQNKKCIYKIIDFNHKKVFEAQTYTAITFINKTNNNSILYNRIERNEIPENFLINTNFSVNSIKDLKIKKWRLLKNEEKDIIYAIENVGTPIGKLFDICVGIATLKDNIYFIDGSQLKNDYYIKHTDNGIFEIEQEVTRSVYKISDFKTQDEAKQNTRRIIFPYEIIKNNARIIPESIFKDKYPKCYLYLLSEKEALLSRDKGKLKQDPFFAWGRTQGLTKTGKKILNPTFSQYPRFFLVEDELAFFTNGYGIFFKDNPYENIDLFSTSINPLQKSENIDVVQKILNSFFMHYYITKTSVSIEGGYPCYQKNFIENFTIPDFSDEDVREMRCLSDEKSITEKLSQKYQIKMPLSNLSI